MTTRHDVAIFAVAVAFATAAGSLRADSPSAEDKLLAVLQVGRARWARRPMPAGN